MEGVEKRYPQRDDKLQKRIDFELNIINKMQYAPYFLIIFDFLDFCYKSSVIVIKLKNSGFIIIKIK